MNIHKSENAIVIVVMGLIVGAMMMDHNLANPLFIALAIGAVASLKGVLILARRSATVAEREFDHQLRMDLLDRKMADTPRSNITSAIIKNDHEIEFHDYDDSMIA